MKFKSKAKTLKTIKLKTKTMSKRKLTTVDFEIKQCFNLSWDFGIKIKNFNEFFDTIYELGRRLQVSIFSDARTNS